MRSEPLVNRNDIILLNFKITTFDIDRAQSNPTMTDIDKSFRGIIHEELTV